MLVANLRQNHPPTIMEKLKNTRIAAMSDFISALLYGQLFRIYAAYLYMSLEYK